ncbi:PGC [Symbiodinium pilosum]|uniref:PGC protein n=1 Tax=Symbiodinium pilosum TaxID=2952 RepID=A0A812UI65_SYMPI|nr:PGC [Symbiodinium pilosum]
MICSAEVIGISLMLASGISVTCEMVTTKVIQDIMRLPFWYLLAVCCAVAASFIGLFWLCRGTDLPRSVDMKWVLARALFENLHWMLAMLSVLVGAAPGDVAALTSIDIIAAALLGLVFLGERVSIFHFLALILSVTGALCISQPHFLFGNVEGERSPVGYCMAMLSGCFQACSFICARKSTHIPATQLAFASLVFAVPAAFLPPICHVGATESVEEMVERPWQVLGLLVILTVWVLVSILLPAAGATRCPAAVSATVFTSSSMITGYVAQTALFSEAPKPLKLLGAGCMLCSVVMMAVRCRGKDSEEACEDSLPDTSATSCETPQDDETLSLGSFVASEVSFTSSSSRLRQRSSSKPLPQRLGACLPLATTSA